MANFAQKKIALAVAGTLVMSGVAQAAGLPAFAAAGKSAVVTNNNDGLGYASREDLFSTRGSTGKVDITLRFTEGVTAVSGTSAGSAPLINTGSGDSINVKYNTTPVPQLKFGTPSTLTSATTYTLTLNPQGGTTETNARVRIDPATGELQYAADGKPGSFVSLTFDVLGASATNAASVLFNQSTLTASGQVAGAYLASALSTQKGYAAVSPNVEVRTLSNNANYPGQVNGLAIDFKTPVTTPTSGAIVFQTRSSSARTLTGATGTTASAVDLSTTGALTFPTAPVASKYNTTTSAFEFVFDPTKVDWNGIDGVTPADTTAYSKNYIDFGSGVTDVVELANGATSSVTYTNVFDATSGLPKAATLSALGATGTGIVKDGAAPVLLFAEKDGANLTLKFSEGLQGISSGLLVTTLNDPDLKEVAENITVGGVSVAALNLNQGGNTLVAKLENTGLSYPAQNQLTLQGGGNLAKIGDTIAVVDGIGFKETNDNGYDKDVKAWDSDNTNGTAGGLTPTSSLSGVASLNAISGSLAATAPVFDLKFDDGTGSTVTSSTEPNKIAQIKLTFAGNKALAFSTGNDVTKLTGQIVVKVDGTNVGGAPVVWEFFPTFTTGDLNTAGDTLTIKLPTELLYTKAPNITSFNVKYLNTATSTAVGATAAPDILVNKSLTTDIVDKSSAGINVNVSKGAGTNLLTQNITGTLEGATEGSTVKAYLAKWNDKATTNVSTVAISRGLITNPKDKDGVVTDLALNFGKGANAASAAGAAKGLIESAILDQLNPATAQAAVAGVSAAVDAGKAKPVNVYVQLTRSNDAVTSGTGNAASLSSASKQQNIQAGAVISNVYNDASFNAYDPVYAVTLDPVTGNITGRLTGKLDITTTTGTTKALGLEVLDADTATGGTQPFAEGLVDATGKFDLLVNTDPTTADLVKKSSSHFVVLVHDDAAKARRYTQLTSADASAPNFVPFEPNLISGKGTKTVLGANGIAAPFVATTVAPTAPKIKLDNYTVVSADFNGWKLLPLAAGNPTVNFDKADIGRVFVGNTSGVPAATWTGDGSSADLAFALANGNVGVATETGAGKATLSTLGNAKFVTGAVALAWNNDAGITSTDVTFTKAPALAKPAQVGAGWSLVTVPVGGLNAGSATTNTIKAVIRVGGQTSVGYSWFVDNDASWDVKNVKEGEAVFVYSKTAGKL